MTTGRLTSDYWETLTSNYGKSVISDYWETLTSNYGEIVTSDCWKTLTGDYWETMTSDYGETVTSDYRGIWPVTMERVKILGCPKSCLFSGIFHNRRFSFEGNTKR